MRFILKTILFIFTIHFSHCFDAKKLESFIPLDINNVLIKFNQDYKLIKQTNFDYKSRDLNFLNNYKKYYNVKTSSNISIDCSNQIANLYKALDQKEQWALKSKLI